MDAFTTRDVFVSTVTPLAVYLAAYVSLKIWRAIQLYDALIMDRRLSRTPIIPEDPLLRYLHLSAGLAFAVALVYDIGSPEFRLESLAVTRLLKVSLVLWTIARPFVDAVSDRILFRHISPNQTVLVPYALHSSEAHRSRTYAACVLTAILAVFEAFHPSDAMYLFIALGLVYRLISRPSSVLVLAKLYHAACRKLGFMPQAIGSGIISLRGLFGIIVGTLFVLGAISLAISVIGLQSDSVNKHLAHNQSDASHAFRPWLIGIPLHALNGLTGMFIALILRYEFSAHHEPVLPLSVPPTPTSPNTSFSMPTLPPSSSSSSSNEVVILETHPSHDKILRQTPSPLAVLVPSHLPSFSSPLFQLCLLALVSAHIPALLVSAPRYRYWMDDFEGWWGIKFFVGMVLQTPVQIGGVLAVLMVFVLALYFRSDANALWNYTEEWELEYDVSRDEDVMREVTQRAGRVY